MKRSGRSLAIGLSVLLGAGAIVVGSIGSASAASGFTAGDVVVYRVGDGSTALSGTAAPVFLDEYAPDGTLVESIPMPTTASGANNPLVGSGSASSEGLLTLSGDGRYLIAPGYDTAVGTAKISSSASTAIPRTVARVAADGTVDTSTALTDFATGNNPRSATSSNGTDLWVGGAAGGPRYATLGATTSTELDSGTFKNVREVSVVDGQLYASADPTKAGLTIGTVGTGEPTTAGQAVTNLPFATPPGDPYAYSLLTLGDGTAPDTLYEADLTAGAVVKYGLVDGSWAAEGSVLVSSVGGLTANDDNGTVTIYATSSGASGTTGTLYAITDDSGVGGTLSGSATTLATLPANEAVRGVAFAPGTVIGTGGGIKPPVVKPTITLTRTALPAALGDPTNPTLPVTIGDANFTADQLDVTASALNPSVAASVSVTGTGADRTLAVTPGSVGISTITLIATAPDGTSTAAQISYGVSADLGNSTIRYFSGAANASAAVDVGDGYAIVGDDESDVLRLYNLADSGAPVTTYDFTSQLPFGTAEIDIEAATRQGDVIYCEGSMSTSDSGDLAPSRSTVFATEISGAGANTTLTYLGSYTGLLSDLISWDQGNNNALGLAASAASGTSGHASDALNVEGLEFAGPNSDTAYLAFRAPLEPTTDRHLAMLIPVTNFADLVNGGVHATFGSPIFFDLGGLGIRDIRSNSQGQFLIIAGTADDTNSGFVLYTWDGNPAHAPLATSTVLPQLPSADNLGAWETIESVPSPLVAGAPLQLLQDDGDVDFYGDGLTSKTGEVTDLQKNLGLVFTYAPPAPLGTSATVTSSANPAAPDTAVTFTATVTGPADEATPDGSVSFAITGADGSSVNCPTPALVDGVATCALPAGALRAGGSVYAVTASYLGDADFAASSATLRQVVTGAPTATAAASLTLIPFTGKPITVVAVVVPTGSLPAPLTGVVSVTVTDASGATVYTTTAALPKLLPLVAITVPGSALPTAGKYTIKVSYGGDEFYSPSTTAFGVQVLKR
jgi:Big-like domain-containing protein